MKTFLLIGAILLSSWTAPPALSAGCCPDDGSGCEMKTQSKQKRQTAKDCKNKTCCKPEAKCCTTDGPSCCEQKDSCCSGGADCCKA
jgi:hypothetical protein